MWRSIEARLYYPALLVALTIPDICSALPLHRNIHVKKNHYIDFVNRYTSQENLGVTGEECYQLRGGIVHRANIAGHSSFKETHVIFTIPESESGLHGFTLDAGEKSASLLDLKVFCREMESAALRWYAANKEKPEVQNNLCSLIRLHPNGVSPFMEGAPVLASGS